MADLDGIKALFISTTYGAEQDELAVPERHLSRSGASVTVATPDGQPIKTLIGDKDPGMAIEAHAKIADVDTSEFDLLVIPGGTINADSLRLDQDALGVVRAFVNDGKTIAAICHGPWALVEADVVKGKNLTSYPSLQTDIRNAGGTWHDSEVQVCDTDEWTLITSRTPKDLDAFTKAIDDAFAPVAA